jgi:hypothetical protein
MTSVRVGLKMVESSRTQRRESVSQVLARIRQTAVSDLPSLTRGRSRMRESRTYGSVRGAGSNLRPYRDRLAQCRKSSASWGTRDVPVEWPPPARLGWPIITTVTKTDDAALPTKRSIRCSPDRSRRSHVRAIVLDHFVSADTSEHPPSLSGRNASAAGIVARSL